MKLFANLLAMFLPNTEAEQIEPILAMAELSAKAAGNAVRHHIGQALRKAAGNFTFNRLKVGQA